VTLLPDTRDQGTPRVTLETFAILLLSIALATAGQLLLKAGMTDAGAAVELSPGALVSLVGTILTTPKLLLGLAAFGSSALFWLVTLSRVPLSTAYPVVSLSYVLILGFSTLVLGERPTPTVWAGALLIMGGVSLVGIGAR
jgi:drug/metabolite transporter (DMT)-like permease